MYNNQYRSDDSDFIELTPKVSSELASLKQSMSSLEQNMSSLEQNMSSLEQNIDTRVESKINSMLLKHLGVKWQSLSIILTAFGIQLALVFFIINTSVSPMKEDIKQLKKDVRSLITMHYKNTDRKPSSNTDKY